MKVKPNYIYFGIILAFLVLVILTLPLHGYYIDEAFWVSWMNKLDFMGLVNVYHDPEVNYLPLYLYFLKGVASFILTTNESRLFYAPYLKIIPLIFDLASVFLVLKILKQVKVPAEKIAFISLNIAFLYNTLIWGQIDGIPVFFVCLSLWLSIKRHPLWAITALMLALNFKLQAIVFVPVIFLVLTPQLWQNKLNIFKAILLAIAIESLILAPYILTGTLPLVWNVITGSVGFYPYISFNAFNFWMLVKGPVNIFATDNNIVFGITSYKNVGLGLFLISSALALWPLIKLVWKELKGKKTDWLNRKVLSKVFLVAGLCAFNFFFFNTQMHERYLHPAILMFAIAAILDGQYLAYILISIGYFLNLEKIMGVLPLGKVPVILNPMLDSTIILLALLSGYWQLYRQTLKDFIAKYRHKTIDRYAG